MKGSDDAAIAVFGDGAANIGAFHEGLNLAASDIHYLYHALLQHYRDKDNQGLAEYSAKALARVWKAERFSWWMTTLLHRFPETGPCGQRIQLAELEYLVASRASSDSSSLYSFR